MINLQQECDNITQFIRDKNKSLKTSGSVIGLSGGLDSSVCATLLVKALGKDNVLGIIMPADDSNSRDTEDAMNLAKILDIWITFHPISYLLNNFDIPKHDFDKEIKPLIIEPTALLPRPLDLSNTMRLRTRAYILGYYAFKNNYFQCQTLEKTEWMLGWFDKFGDAAGDIAPIFHLYKTQVRQLAEFLKLPDFILNREPGSGNYPLNDEQELGMSLEEVDSILYHLEKNTLNVNFEDILELTDIERNKIKRIRNQVEYTRVKREIPYEILRSG